MVSRATFLRWLALDRETIIDTFAAPHRARKPHYNQRMARGWESKSVEAQQAEASEKSTPGGVKLTPEAAARAREKENLRLARKRVLQQLEQAQNERHRKLLEQTLADLEEKLSKFQS